MTTHVIKNSTDLDALKTIIEGQALPFTVDIRKGKHRTVEQNKLQFKWMQEIYSQTAHLGTFDSPEHVRGYCKLHFGVPIMRELAEFQAGYDKIIKPMAYETKLELMQEPLDFNVTRLMTTEQKTRYLDAIYRHFTETIGLRLTRPER